MINSRTKKILLSIGSQKDLAKLLGISYSYFRTLISVRTKQEVPIPLAKKMVDISDGKIKIEELRPDLKWIIQQKTVEDKRKELKGESELTQLNADPQVKKGGKIKGE